MVLTALVFVFALVTLGAWTLASPVGSSPDDDFHLASIWCAQGTETDTCSTGSSPTERRVSKDLFYQSRCEAYDPSRSAACQGSDFGRHPDVTISTPRGNFEGQYPPLFYDALSLFATPDIVPSVLVMRSFDAVLFLGLVGALFFVAQRRWRVPLAGSVLATAVPLGLFLIPSTNPSSWAYASAAVLWIAVAAYYRASGRQKVALGSIATIATLMGSGARSDSAAYSILAIAIGALLSASRTRRFAIDSVLPVVLVVISLVFFLRAGQAGVAQTGFVNATPSDLSWTALLITNLQALPGLWGGIFGADGWGLGWLDVPLPALTWGGGIAVFAMAVAIGLRRMDRRHRLAAATVLLALVAVPLLLLQNSHAEVGSYVQPRYILPLAVMLVGVALSSSMRRRVSPTPTQAIVLLSILSVSSSAALYSTIRRYVTGVDARYLDLDLGAEWWWTGSGLSPNAVWAIGSLGFAAMCATMLIPFVRTSRQKNVSTKPTTTGSGASASSTSGSSRQRSNAVHGWETPSRTTSPTASTDDSGTVT